MSFDLSSYVEVSERIREWYERFPEGRITTTVEEWVDDRVMVRAEAYRGLRGELDFDPPAGTGHSYLAIPGKTPYTAGAELENAETSAVGRALVMAGLSSKTVASADEVRAKHKPKAKAAPKDWGAQSQQAPHNEGASSSTDEGKGARAEKSDPAGGQLLGEGAVPPAGEDTESLQVRVGAYFGSLAKAALWCKRTHPEWNVRTDADLTDDHYRQIVAEVAA